MKTLVAGAVLSFAALTLSFAAPAAADDATPTPPVESTAPSAPPPAEVLTPMAPEISAECSGLGVIVYDLYPTQGRMGIGWGPADKGQPPITQVFGPNEGATNVMFEPNSMYVSTAMNWRVVVWRSDGTIAWDEHGTTTPCPAPPLPKHAQLVKPPAPPCGSTLDDVAWPSTPGVVYSHDEWNGYARLLPGWEWVNANFDAITGWWLQGGSSSADSTLVWLPRQLILNPTGKCGANATPPETSRVDSPCWSGLAHPQPCPTPLVYVPTKPEKMSAPPTTTTFPVPPADATTPAQRSPAPTPAVAVTTRPTGSPSPAPSPSATPAAQATPRVGTSTGLGVAGGLVGACVLTAAGAFVVRRRLRPETNVVVMDEPVGDEPVD